MHRICTIFSLEQNLLTLTMIKYYYLQKVREIIFKTQFYKIHKLNGYILNIFKAVELAVRTTTIYSRVQ